MATLLFTRQEKLGLENFAVVTVEPAADQNEALALLKRALTDWAGKTVAGRAEWQGTGEDFNIGDFLLCESDPDLQSTFEKFGVKVKVLVSSDSTALVSYDEVLIDSDKF
ncbi:hypothetical protein [Photobacterium leiognathi]|uniref:hypothetical protein n=1 Tax=Photobacterium leiognathi TaxID=553611 RepID=UPI002980AE9D|nr:hypothetical protein [Photobacterium leiognathi]